MHGIFSEFAATGLNLFPYLIIKEVHLTMTVQTATSE